MSPTNDGIIDVRIDEAAANRVQAQLAGVHQGFERAISGGINDTLKRTKTRISSRVRKRIMIKKRDIDEHIETSRANVKRFAGRIRLEKSQRLSLKRFGARQTRRGVSYRIARSGGRQRITDAFGPEIDRLGRHVYRRVGKGRFPIRKLLGPSPWGVYVKAGMHSSTLRFSRAMLNERIEGRIHGILQKHAKNLAAASKVRPLPDSSAGGG